MIARINDYMLTTTGYAARIVELRTRRDFDYETSVQGLTVIELRCLFADGQTYWVDEEFMKPGDERTFITQQALFALTGRVTDTDRLETGEGGPP